MEEEKLPMLWLQAHGYGNGAVQVVVEYPEPRLLLLGRGWKSFVHAHNLWDGHTLRFKMVAANLLSVKVYGSSGIRLSCCEESFPRARTTRRTTMAATATTGQSLGRSSLSTRI